MKKFTFICLVTLALIISFVACKKDKDENIAPTLMGKWSVENSITKEYMNGSLVGTYTEPGNGSTMDFQDNGHVIITYPGSPIESLTYSIKPDSKVEIDGDIFEVKNLSKSSVTLYLRQDYSPGEYDEVYINLKR